MFRPVVVLFIGIVVLGLAIQQALALHRQTATSPPSTRGLPTALQLTPTSPPPRSVSSAVAIGVDGLNYVFSPANETVRAGTTLFVVNRTAAPHTVTSLAGKQFDVTVRGWHRGVLTLRKPGTYRYFCAYHPYMLGVITVMP